MSRNIVPRIDKGSDLGTVIKKWGTVYSDTVNTNTIILSDNNLQALLDGKVDLDTLMAKGDLYVATGPGRITRLPAGSDGQVLKTNSTKPEGLMWGPAGARQELTNSITVTVGNTGDYSTINEALESIVALYYPIYKFGGTCPTVTINLQSGFVMSEQVLVESLDLSWIRITGEDAVTTINRSALTNRLVPSSSYPAFGAKYGGFLPIIEQLFSMDDSGDSTNRDGITVYLNSRAVIYKYNKETGVMNAGGNGINILYSSIVSANDTNFSGAGNNGIYAMSSRANVVSVDVSGAGNNGIDAEFCSDIVACYADISNAGNNGIYACHNSTVNADHGNISGANRYGIFAQFNSFANAGFADVSEAGVHSIFASDGSIIDAPFTEVSSSSETMVHNIKVSRGGIVVACEITISDSRLSQTPNTITTNGIIFK